MLKHLFYCVEYLVCDHSDHNFSEICVITRCLNFRFTVFVFLGFFRELKYFYIQIVVPKPGVFQRLKPCSSTIYWPLLFIDLFLCFHLFLCMITNMNLQI